jgi:hypothetical protein
MRAFGYWLGVVLLIAGAAAALAELFTVVQGAPSVLAPGTIWFRIHATSLVGFQALIEKSAVAFLWPPIQFVLGLPSWLLLVTPGLALIVLCREKSR